MAVNVRSEDWLERICRVCGCTQQDCSQCVEVLGHPCWWFEDDLCSRCAADLLERVAAGRLFVALIFLVMLSLCLAGIAYVVWA